MFKITFLTDQFVSRTLINKKTLNKLNVRVALHMICAFVSLFPLILIYSCYHAAQSQQIHHSNTHTNTPHNEHSTEKLNADAWLVSQCTKLLVQSHVLCLFQRPLSWKDSVAERESLSPRWQTLCRYPAWNWARGKPGNEAMHQHWVPEWNKFYIFVCLFISVNIRMCS